MDGRLPFGGTLCPACSSICEIHVDLWPGSRCHTVLPRPKRTRLPTMSTIELVDPELRDALALWPQVSLTAETLTQRRADGLAGNEGCGEQAFRVRAEMRDLFRGISPRAGSAAPGAVGGHLLGVCLAA